MSEFIGQIISGYRLERLIGEGGMSQVWLAKDAAGRSFAVKLLDPQSGGYRAEDLVRFKREAETVSRLDHPGILKIFACGDYDGCPYLVMEYLSGFSLEELFDQNRRFTPQEAITIISQTAQVLDYIHTNGLLHRDLKPANIMLVQRSEFNVQSKENKYVERSTLNPEQFTIGDCKLLDFGLAYIMDLTKISEEKEIAGTFGYMSPEASGIILKPLDERSDLYSLGAVLYRLLSGRPAFASRERSQILHQQAAQQPQSPGAGEELDTITLKLLQKEPDLRYQSAKGLLYDLLRYQKGERGFLIAEKDPKIKISYQTKLIGREEELTKLKNLYDEARSGKTKICFINGEPGSGKTRLVEELRRYSYEQGGMFISGRCLNQENKQPYQPFSDAINGYLRYLERSTEDKRKQEIERINAVLGDLGEVVARLNPHIKKVIGDTKPLIALEPERENQRFLMVSARFFKNLGTEGKPCVLMLDDLQWTDEGTMSLLDEILRQGEQGAVLVLSTYRTEEVGEGHSVNRLKQGWQKANFSWEELPLQIFDLKRTQSLVAGLLGEKEESANLISLYIQDKSRGNVFFSINILRELIDSKALTWQEGDWKQDSEKMKTLAISTSLADLLIKKSVDLPTQLTQLLETAAVIGRQFEMGLLSKVLDLSIEETVVLIDDATRRQLLDPARERGEYLFSHDRIHEAFLSRQMQEAKKERHLKIARTIEKDYGSSEIKYLYALAHHYTEAQVDEKIIEYALPAADKAKENYANEEAIRYYNAAIMVLEKQDLPGSPAWIKAKQGQLQVYLIINKNEKVIQISKQLFDHKLSLLEKAVVYGNMGSAYFHMGEFKKCEEHILTGLELLGKKAARNNRQAILGILINGLKLFLHFLRVTLQKSYRPRQATPEQIEACKLYYQIAWLYAFSSSPKFLNNSLKAVYYAETLDIPAELKGLLGWIFGSGIAFVGLFKLGLEITENSMAGFKNNVFLMTYANFSLAFIASWDGKYILSLEYTKKMLECSLRIGDIWLEGLGYHLLGHINYYPAVYDKAKEYLIRYFDISKKVADFQGMAASLNYQGMVEFEKGNILEAKKLINEALDFSLNKAICFTECEARLYKGIISIYEGEFDAAISEVNKAAGLNKKNYFYQDYVGAVYHTLAESYIEKARKLQGTEKKKILRETFFKVYSGVIRMKLWPNHYAGALRVAGKYWAVNGGNKIAERYFKRSIDHAVKLGRRFEEAKTRYEYGLALQEWNHETKSLEELNKAYDIFKTIGAKLYQKRCADLLGIKEEIPVSQTAAQRLQEEQGLEALMVTARNLSSILDLGVLLEKIIDESLKVTGAERGALLLYSEKDKTKLDPAVTRNLDEGTLRSESFRFSQTIINKTAETKQPQLVLDALSDTDLKTQDSIVAQGLRSVLCAPLMAREELLGLVYLDNKLSSGIFSEQKKEVLQTLAAQAAVSIENARLYAQVQDKARMEEELRLGRHIQANLIPKIVPKIEGLVLAGLMEPAKEIGGDYYDFIVMKSYVQRSEFNVQSEENRNVQSKENKYVERSALNPEQPAKLAIAIGDVSGKGVGAGMLMASAKATLRSLCGQGFGPAQILKRANRLMYQYTHGEQMMTMLLMEWDPQTRQLSYSSCGHEHILISRVDGRFEAIRSGGLMMGIIEDIGEYTLENKLNLEPGDVILLYTDGATEARDQNGNMFNLERLKEAFTRYRSLEPDALVTAVKSDVTDFMSGADQYDDITLVAMRFDAAADTQTEVNEITVEQIKLELFADMEVVPATRAMIMDIAARKEYAQGSIQELNTIIDELLTNAIRHGSPSRHSRINLECLFFDDRVEVTVIDEGNKPFDYQAILNEHRAIVEREQREGKVSEDMVGRGLILIEHFSDRVQIERVGLGNRVAVVKKMGNG